MLLFLRGAMTPDDLAPSPAQVYFQYDINGAPVTLFFTNYFRKWIWSLLDANKSDIEPDLISCSKNTCSIGPRIYIYGISRSTMLNRISTNTALCIYLYGLGISYPLEHQQ